MKSVRVKICGIRRLDDALLAASCGADAIGLLVGQRHNSPDFITPENARHIATSLPPFVSATLVTHLENPDEVETLLAAIPVKAVQIHSEMTPSAILQIRQKFPSVTILKSFHVISSEVIEYGETYREIVDGFVLDSINVITNQVGGTGNTHDWAVSKKIVDYYTDVPIILAGGLNSANVNDAIKAVRPYAVDVNSGTKGSDGYKDQVKLREFITRAKGC